MAKQVAIYSRKSKFTGKGESIENQIELCRQYIISHCKEDCPVEIFVYEDEGFSAKNTDRPQFKKMLQDAKKKMFTAIVCYRLDRISRNVSDFANLIEELNRQGIAFISISEMFDTSTPMGRAMMFIASVFAQLERETIAERIRDNMYELSKTGRWLGGTTPTGYKSESVEKITVDGKLKKAYKLKLIPEEARIIILIYEKFLETGSLTKTDAYLVQNNYTTKNHKYYTRFAIRNILTNPVYMIADEAAYRYFIERKADLFADGAEFDGKHGIMAYNRTLQTQGRANRERNIKEWVISVGKHEGIIYGNSWVKVQQLLEQNKSKTYRRPRSNTALLSGLLFCGGCGSHMRSKSGRGKSKDMEKNFYYLCSLKEKSKCRCCDMKNPSGNQADRVVYEEIKKLPPDNQELIRQLEILDQTFSAGQEEYGNELLRLQKSLKDIENEIGTLVNTLARAAGSASEGYILSKIDELNCKKEQQIGKLRDARDLYGRQEYSAAELETLKQTLLRFEDNWTEASVEEKREAIRSVIKKTVWDGIRLQIYFL